MSDRLTRRSASLGTLGVLGTAAVGCDRPPRAKPEKTVTQEKTTKFPTIYVPHGGGPWPFVSMSSMPETMMGGLRGYLEGLPAMLPEAPRALLVVSAHWEERVPTVQAAPKPTMLYDYSGFPAEAYEVKWPAPGAPEVATQVRTLLEGAGIESAEEKQRGFDHGTFVVTKLMYPDANVPTFQLSLTGDLDPARLLAIGRALSPLREQGVLILGSGFSYHNMREFGNVMRGAPGPRDSSKAFDDWLAETVTQESSARASRLIAWANAPSARACHPREEHLLPLMVCAGAALDDIGTTPFRAVVMGVHTLAAHFG